MIWITGGHWRKPALPQAGTGDWSRLPAIETIYK